MRRLAQLVIVCCLLSAAAVAQEKSPAFRTRFPRKLIDPDGSGPVLTCTRVTTPPKIDGEVDRDPVWKKCGRTEGAWTQLGTKNISSRQTVVYACYDSETLYLAFVCEEPELQRVRMDGPVTSADSVEAVIEIGGLNGEGDVYSFLANARGREQGWGFRKVRTAMKGQYHPWKSAGKFGPNRWMVEMAIPFSSLRRERSRIRISNPQRGEIIGIKFARYGPVMKTGEKRMVSTWNVRIPYEFLYICGYNGLLYFEDSSALRDGDFSADAGTSAWKVTGDVKRAKGEVTLAAGANLSQRVGLRPDSFYVLSAKTDGKGKLRAVIDGRTLDLSAGRTGEFWSGPKQTSAVVTLKALTPVKLHGIHMRYEPGEEPPGVWCITNNYRRAKRNIRNVLPDAPEGKYRYVTIDYAGRVTRDDNPSRLKPSWSRDLTRRILDVGGTEGWIEFSKGSLTGKPLAAFWQTVNPADYNGWGRHEFTVIDIDLGQEYFVLGLDVLKPGPYMGNIEVWGKPEGAGEWIYLYTAGGQFVEPSKRVGYLGGYASVRGLDSVVRHLRWRSTERYPQYPQMDGIQEFWVWGEPRGKHKSGEVKHFKPWVSAERVPKRRPKTWTPKRDSAQIVPRPRRQQMGTGWFVAHAQTRIVFQDEVEARRIARQIRDEMRERWNVVPALVAEKDVGTNADDIIYVGQPRTGEFARKLAREESLDVDADKPAPQGYGVRVTPRRVVVLGRDGDGLYWGIQSLMMAMCWRNANEPERSGPAVPAMTIHDWPGTLERAEYQRRGYAAMLSLPYSEIGRVKRVCKLMSRFKYNAIYLNAGLKQTAAWPKGALAKLCREIRRDCHLEIRPILLTTEEEGGGWWQSLIESRNAWHLAEHDPDEPPQELRGSMNICPLKPESYELIFERIDETLEAYGNPTKVWLFGQAYTSVWQGSRWAQCRTCRRSGKSPEEIYLYFLHRIAEHLERRGVKGVLRSNWIRYGPRDPKDRRRLVVDPREVPGTLQLDLLGSRPVRATKLQEYRTFIAKHLHPDRTANGPADWPSQERQVLGAHTESEITHSLAGGVDGYRDGRPMIQGNLAEIAEGLWYAPDPPPRRPIDRPDLAVWVNAWWNAREFPAWRNGRGPTYVPIDLREVANHPSHATGLETLQSGRTPGMDLTYLDPGRQCLGGVEFRIIDPSQNDGRGLLMLGRPPGKTVSQVKAVIAERAGPVPVGRKLASIAFLRARWRCGLGGNMWTGNWLRPTCRVVYDDDTWLVVDSYLYESPPFCNVDWNNNGGIGELYRLGWQSNTPNGRNVWLKVVEWVNPYPEKPVKALDFFTPGMEDRFGKRVNIMAEGIVAVSGVEATQHDIDFWATRTDRDPLLPSLRKRSADGIELKGTHRASERRDRRGQLAGPNGPISYACRFLAKTQFFNYGRYDAVCIRTGFKPFGAALTFDKPRRLSRVELVGPMCNWGPKGAQAARKQKVDVTVEISQDGTTWRKVGAVRGISAQTDFLPVDLPDTAIKAIRLTGDASPYHRHYRQTRIISGLFTGKRNMPHFAWRLFALAEADARK